MGELALIQAHLALAQCVFPIVTKTPCNRHFLIHASNRPVAESVQVVLKSVVTNALLHRIRSVSLRRVQEVQVLFETVGVVDYALLHLVQTAGFVFYFVHGVVREGMLDFGEHLFVILIYLPRLLAPLNFIQSAVRVRQLLLQPIFVQFSRLIVDKLHLP